MSFIDDTLEAVGRAFGRPARRRAARQRKEQAEVVRGLQDELDDALAAQAEAKRAAQLQTVAAGAGGLALGALALTYMARGRKRR